MEMTQVFDKLKSLQDILAERYALEKEVDELPRSLASDEETLNRIKAQFIEEHDKSEEIKSEYNALRLEYDEAEKLRESAEKSIGEMTTNREYEALSKQKGDAEVRERDLRKEMQGVEKKLSDIEEKMKSDEQMIQEQERNINAARESIDKDVSSRKTRLAALEKKEAKIAPDIDQEILFKFRRIIQRNTEGIVAVKGGVCSGCHMILPAQFANEARKGESILFCPYCSRILFYEESDEGEGESYYADTGSLVGIEDDDFEEEDDGDDDGDSPVSDEAAVRIDDGDSDISGDMGDDESN